MLVASAILLQAQYDHIKIANLELTCTFMRLSDTPQTDGDNSQIRTLHHSHLSHVIATFQSKRQKCSTNSNALSLIHYLGKTPADLI